MNKFLDGIYELERYKVIHLCLLPLALMGVMGYSMALLVMAQVLGTHDIVIDTITVGVSIGSQFINLISGNLPINDGVAVIGYFLGFATIPVVLFCWGTFLFVGWFYHYPQDKQPAIKTLKGWISAFVYYPLVIFGCIALLMLVLFWLS